jgi:hypothetical protein
MNARKSQADRSVGTLESGHIYFLYRPKIDHGDDVGSLDDISKYVQAMIDGEKADHRFHMVLIPKSPPHDKGHFHRIIEIGKKKMPDPGAKNQVIWGLVSGVGDDKGAFKDSFGAYSYETKTRGESLFPGGTGADDRDSSSRSGPSSSTRALHPPFAPRSTCR